MSCQDLNVISTYLTYCYINQSNQAINEVQFISVYLAPNLLVLLNEH